MNAGVHRADDVATRLRIKARVREYLGVRWREFGVLELWDSTARKYVNSIGTGANKLSAAGSASWMYQAISTVVLLVAD